MSSPLPSTADVVVVGAGIVGACCAHFLADEGLDVLVLDRGAVSGGTTGAGEGNILVSDKDPGPELELALVSSNLWTELGDFIGEAAELELKGGLIVATSESSNAALVRRARRQGLAGVDVVELTPNEAREHEPLLAAGLAGACMYPQDMQVQPMLAASHLLAPRTRIGRVTVITQCEVKSVQLTQSGAIKAVVTSQGEVATPLLVNAAGAWAGEVAKLAGVSLPILPRRGFILVTEPLPHVIHHKVYTADYIDNVASDSAGLETSTVIEGTQGGPILIGSSRERVGFDRTPDWPVLAGLAALAIAVFPFLASVQLLRAYAGFRPYCPDHLPVIGPDPQISGLFHACGHEGSGVSLAPVTGVLLAEAIMDRPTRVSLAPFLPGRFEK
ncbi:MAG: FAD-binding oxidoreductase [Actinomycetes bacterium]